MRAAQRSKYLEAEIVVLRWGPDGMQVDPVSDVASLQIGKRLAIEYCGKSGVAAQVRVYAWHAGSGRRFCAVVYDVEPLP